MLYERQTVYRSHGEYCDSTIGSKVSSFGFIAVTILLISKDARKRKFLGLWNTPTAHLQRSNTPSQWVSRRWHWTIWWWGSIDARALGNAEHLFIAIAPRSTLAQNGSIWKGPIYGLNRTKLRTCAKLNYLNQNCLTKLNSLKKKCFSQSNCVLEFKLCAYAELNLYRTVLTFNCM